MSANTAAQDIVVRITELNTAKAGTASRHHGADHEPLVTWHLVANAKTATLPKIEPIDRDRNPGIRRKSLLERGAGSKRIDDALPRHGVTPPDLNRVATARFYGSFDHAPSPFKISPKRSSVHSQKRF